MERMALTSEETQHILAHTEGDFCPGCAVIHARISGGDDLDRRDREHLIELFGADKPHCSICRSIIEKLRSTATEEGRS